MMKTYQDYHQFQAELESGRMTLDIRSHMEGWNAETLFAMAQRRNPKRAFLFVSKVLGRHIPCSPALIRKAFTDLAIQIPSDLPGPVLVTGMAETAVGLAAGVHQYLSQQREDTIFISSTRHPVEGDLLCRFEEEHSHATAHLVYLPDDEELRQRVLNARSIVMVDDEATTGKTFLNLLTALKNAGLSRIENVVTATLTDWSDGEISRRVAGNTLSVCLASGKWQWEPSANALALDCPDVNVTACGVNSLNKFAGSWGRKGVAIHQRFLSASAPYPGERILVLGSGEYVWQPFLLAEWLEKQGAEVRFSATTRSPVAIGHAIDCAFSFSDNYGLGIPMFVYNIVPEIYDRILLCSETAAETWDPRFTSRFANLEIIVE